LNGGLGINFKREVIDMFYGGLNGDGFFNDEYSDGGYEDGEGSRYGYVSPTSMQELGVIKTGIETENAVQLRFKDMVNFWMPKKALTSPHFDGVMDWSIAMLHNNIKAAIKKISIKA
jgi:hypothetical protein